MKPQYSEMTNIQKTASVLIQSQFSRIVDFLFRNEIETCSFRNMSGQWVRQWWCTDLCGGVGVCPGTYNKVVDYV
jgi:hypothetical protein